jgi:hypothetical protein
MQSNVTTATPVYMDREGQLYVLRDTRRGKNECVVIDTDGKPVKGAVARVLPPSRWETDTPTESTGPLVATFLRQPVSLPVAWI